MRDDTAASTDGRWLGLLAAIGAAATSLLLVAVPLVELLAFEFSALVALPLGLLAGVATLIGVGYNFAALHPVRRRAIVAYAAFGPAVLLTFGLAYVNVGRELVTVEVAAGVGLAATAVVYAALGRVDSDATL